MKTVICSVHLLEKQCRYFIIKLRQKDGSEAMILAKFPAFILKRNNNDTAAKDEAKKYVADNFPGAKFLSVKAA